MTENNSTSKEPDEVELEKEKGKEKGGEMAANPFDLLPEELLSGRASFVIVDLFSSVLLLLFYLCFLFSSPFFSSSFPFPALFCCSLTWHCVRNLPRLVDGRSLQGLRHGLEALPLPRLRHLLLPFPP